MQPQVYGRELGQVWRADVREERRDVREEGIE